jgi:benzoyl-CoA reductase/2-hydroxyglutaryl-CoA dehydratase subunit BcrC/BadD/HgdB
MKEPLETLKEIRAMVPAGPYGKDKGGCHAPALKAWKQNGGKILGFQCLYVPEEIIHAAGMLSVRLTGGLREMPLDDANAYLYHNSCSFIRTNMQLLLEGHYNFLDGYVAGGSCDPPLRFYDAVVHYKLFPFTHLITVPRRRSEWAHDLYRTEVEKFVEVLEKHFGVRVTDEALWKSIAVFEKTRQLFRKLYDLRKSDTCAITGAEVMDVYNVMFMMPREQFNALLERLVDEVGSAKGVNDGRMRLLINGSPLNNPEFIRAIENEGSVVVVEELCTGSRYWWKSLEAKPGEKPLDALCRRYLDNEACARMNPSEERWEEVLQRAKEWRVDGVVSQIIRYCVSYGSDQPMLRRKLEEAGFPVLDLDVEYGQGGTGQIKTRAQAFMEMLRGRVKS